MTLESEVNNLREQNKKLRKAMVQIILHCHGHVKAVPSTGRDADEYDILVENRVDQDGFYHYTLEPKSESKKVTRL